MCTIIDRHTPSHKNVLRIGDFNMGENSKEIVNLKNNCILFSIFTARFIVRNFSDNFCASKVRITCLVPEYLLYNPHECSLQL